MMAEHKRLSKRQFAVIEDLFRGELDESAVLRKHKVSRITYNKWLADEFFKRQFDERVESAYRQSELIIARYAPLAAAKLVQLTESESQETARKVCLDIISLRRPAERLAVAGSAMDKDSEPQSIETQLSPETAGKILSALAEQKK
jgi:hypothetical protein